LLNDNFTGTGKTATHHVGGIDINSSSHIQISSTTASDFSKNGISFTAQYAPGDIVTNSITLNNVSSTNNGSSIGWAGLAFYTTNSAGGQGNSIRDVYFQGTNTFSGNTGQGIFIEGDSDANLGAHVKPRYVISGKNKERVDLGTAVFSGNTTDILNYQTKGVFALKATFGGITGDNMTLAQIKDEKTRIFDHIKSDRLGYVRFFIKGHNKSPKNGYTAANAGILKWHKVRIAVSYDYESSYSKTVDAYNKLTSPIYNANVSTNQIDATGTPPGTYYWQERPVFSDGTHGVWSNPWKLVVTPSEQ
ncbi:MAG: hypothetical protein ACHQT9_05105, partial [Candidatus Saccharimonadales bacterium]